MRLVQNEGYTGPFQVGAQGGVEGIGLDSFKYVIVFCVLSIQLKLEIVEPSSPMFHQVSFLSHPLDVF